MKKIFLLASLYVFAFTVNAQEEKIKVKDGKIKIKSEGNNDVDDNGFTLFLTPLSVGFTHWIYTQEAGYFHDINKHGSADSSHQLLGNGLNLGPQLALMYSCGRWKFGVEGGYNVLFINKLNPKDGVTNDVFNISNNRRKTYTIGGKVMYDVIKGEHISLLPHLGGGTFSLREDNFSSSNKARLYGRAGLMLQVKLGKFSVFADPNYTLSIYKIKSTPDNIEGYIHNINMNMGIGYKF